MLVELGNAAALKADNADPRVTYLTIPEADEQGLGGYTQPDQHDDSMFPEELATALQGVASNSARRMIIDGYLSHPSGVRGFPEHEAFISIIHPGGAWKSHSLLDPTWVHCPGHPGLEKMLGDYFGCPIGQPNDVEDTHWTRNGMPGVGPEPWSGINMLKTNAGNDLQSIIMGGGLMGETGTATAATATSLTTNSGTTHSTNDLAGQIVIAWTTGVYGLITANTSGTNTVLTLDRWYVPATPGGAAATTPSGTTGYTIMVGSLPAFFMGLTATVTSPVSGDTTLAGEITTAGGGLIRKICPYGHTAGVANFTLTPVFTATGSDALPVTVAKAGVGPSIVATVKQLFQTLLNATATFSLSGDQVTITDTVSL